MLLVLSFLVLKPLDMLVSLLHLVLAVFDLLLQLVIMRLEHLMVFLAFVQGFLTAL